MIGARYVLGSRIASGGMAEIHLGKQVSKDGFERLCAIKRILPHLSSNRDFIEMFRDEAHICKKLQHTNIVRIEGFEEIDGSFAIIMELVDGSDLRSILSACERSKSRLSVPMALFVSAEAARGLHYAHTKRDDMSQAALGIVHRDISPQNIMISYEGEVKVTDFGIAKAKNKNTETQTGTVKGKYSYMSPEQITAQKTDRRSDIFSLGIVLWETLAMRKLFQAGNDVTTIGRVRNCKITTSLCKENKNVTPELEKIILKCLAKDPKDRYQTADEMEKAVRKFLYANYSDFSTHVLGKFLKGLLNKKRKQMRKSLQTMLSQKSSPAAAEMKLALAKSRHTEEKHAPRLPPQAEDGNAARKIEFAPPTTLSDPAKRKKGHRAVATQREAKPSNYLVLKEDLSKSVRESKKEVLTPHAIRARGKRRGQQKSSSLNMLVVASIIFVVGIIAYVVKNKQDLRLSRPSYLGLKLDTTPSRVKISIDDKLYKNGAYQKTPLVVQTTAGKHLVKIFRQGYRPRKFEYRGGEGQTIGKTLVLEPSTRMSAVRIVSENASKKYLLDINNGFFVGESPALVPDLVYNKRHSVRITPKGGGRTQQFACSFVPTSRSVSRPHLLVIKRGRCVGRTH